jgi:hypothetical protein
MDSDDEMMMELLMQDEAAADEQEQQMMVLTAMLRYREQLAAIPRRGCSRVRKAMSKDRQRFACALLLDSYYFAEYATNTPKEFRHHFRMNKEDS